MAEFPALPLFTDSFLADCSHLPDHEMGLYLRLLILMWRTPDCRIPNDPNWIARKLGKQPLEYSQTIAPLVQEFCITDGNFLTQKRLRKEHTYLRDQSAKQRENAGKRWSTNSVDNSKNPDNSIDHDKALKNKDNGSCQYEGSSQAIGKNPQNDFQGKSVDKNTVSDKLLKSKETGPCQTDATVMPPTPPHPLSKNPPLPPEQSTGQGGALKNGRGEEGVAPLCHYSIVHLLSDKVHEKAKLLCKSLNRDFYNLCRIYDEGVTSGKRPPPKSPDSAFPAWISAYTKNERL